MKAEIQKLPKSTIQIDVVVPVEKVKEIYDRVLADITDDTEIKGFRKGKAPKDLVEKSVDQSKLLGEAANKVLEKYYVQALKENKIAPISNPKIDIKGFALDKDFAFTAIVAVKPDIKLGDYKSKLKQVVEDKHKASQKQKEGALKEGKPLSDAHDHLHSNEIIDVITNSAEIEIAEMLIEEEVDRMMSRLVDQTQSLNMQIDQYLKAQNKTAEQLRTEFSKMAENNIKAEFAMAEAIKQMNITVTDEEVEEMAKASGDPQAVESIKDPVHKWYIKSILEKNKLITALVEEFGGEDPAKEEK